ncbi:MAG TPA: hypothetical protein VGM03_11295, partial [Phycisphaerae bacterium]
MKLATTTALTTLIGLAVPSLAEDTWAIRGGELRMVQPNGPVTGVCPLTHTDVQADIAGFVGRTRVKQTFTNPLD